MAQTTIASPQVLTPAYNPIKYIVDSTNKNKNGFKYIFDIYESGTANKIGEYKVLPTFGTGYGEEDLSKLLQTQVSWDLQTQLTSFYGAPNSYYQYDVKVGEEFVAEFAYTSSLTNASGNVQINVTNTFASGDQDLYLNIVNPKGTDRVIFENSNGGSFYKAISSADEIVQVPVGPNNYGILVGTGDLIDNNTEWYEFFFANGATLSQQDSVRYRVYLDRRVLISEYHILFLDRMGSWSSFAFQLKSYERGDVTRELYNQDVAGFVNGADEWTYNTEEFGFRSMNINVTKSFDLNTNWMTQNMATYFEELVTSPQTFLKIVTYVTTEDGIPLIDEDGCPIHIPESTLYQPCIVNNNSYEVFNQRNKNLIKQSISVRLANQDNING
jgi:hypothetical protein